MKPRGPLTLLLTSSKFRRRGAMLVGLMIILYLVSIGPTERWYCQTPSKAAESAIYAYVTPVRFLYNHGPKPIRDAIGWYSDLWADSVRRKPDPAE